MVQYWPPLMKARPTTKLTAFSRGGVLEQDHRRQAAGPGKKKLVEVVGLPFVGGPHFAPAGDEEDPYFGVIDAGPAELPVVQAHHRGEARQARHHLLERGAPSGAFARSN